MLHLFDLLSGDGLILAIFVLGFLALPYSPDMRRVLGRLPIFRGWIEKSDASQFILLRRLHNDTYHLIVVILGYSIKLLIRWVALGVAILLAYDAASLLSLDLVSSPRRIALIAAAAFGCPLLGIVQWIFWTRKLLLDLGEYDEAARKVAEELRSKAASA